MSSRVELPVGARVRVIKDDVDPLHDMSEVGTVVSGAAADGEAALYKVRFDGGKEIGCRFDELERVDMW